ncbi:LapD/MoxY N-terminal periplasmic domain-containing protein [Azoarcus sp. KH32C]|uniref:bifunctional diguanylate cyclase/phosphodiesterase n=1 Tax=Azoarcus sp. KH32C TaxID=748247 RepID=UPI0002385F31|nr:LapD/MoxY N-terminal periplasmic domain-containing protein [Azoarcus sp. KH32C]BAL26144.1 hypothetical protein AZKH_3860 [Azoarcus sp. KH32C]
MSLIKQLWIAIVVVTLLALGGNLIVSTLSARHYLEQQLRVKNLDNATSLALSLSQLPKDPVTVELQIAAQFDAGHYRLIRLVSPKGDVLVEREYEGDLTGAPNWFTRLVPIAAPPGVAQVQDGWHQFGTLSLESHSRYAYEALWTGTIEQLLWFLVGGILTGITGTLIIRHITRPLHGVVEQAEAIGGRRFVTTPEPGTTEFRSVVRAMNALSVRVRTMLAEESGRLEQLRRQVQHDALTGLYSREQFMNLLHAAVSRDDAQATGSLLIVRIGELTALNQRLGREGADRVLKRTAECLAAVATPHADWETGRINGSDLALVAPGEDNPERLAAEVADALRRTMAKEGEDTALPIAASRYAAGETRSAVLARVDGALATAEQAGGRAIRIVENPEARPLHADLQSWRSALMQSLNADGVRLGRYPVVSRDRKLMHFEAPMRLQLAGEWQPAGVFMPWVARLGLLPQFDIAVVRAALDKIAASGDPLGINLSSASLCDAAFRSELFRLLQDRPAEAAQLWLDLPEYGALRHTEEFRSFCIALKPTGCKVGVEHVGAHFGQMSDLHELGLDYLKIDASIVRGIDADKGNQSFLRGLCVIAHSIGLLTIAEGVRQDNEMASLTDLGIDGMTGSAVRMPT